MTTLHDNAQRQLKQYIEQVERLEEDKQGIAADIRDKYSEMKANGYDTKVVRQLVKLRKLSPNDREEQDAVLHTYMHAVGMISKED